MQDNDKPNSGLELITGDDAAPEKGIVAINGTRYPMADVSDAGLRERSRIQKLLARITKLEGLDEPSEDDEHEYKARLRELAVIALPTLEKETLEKLRVGHLSDLAIAFFTWAASTSPRLAVLTAARTRVSQQTPPSSPPDSSGSTAAIPADGSSSGSASSASSPE